MNIIAGILLIILLGGPAGITLGIIWILIGLWTWIPFWIGVKALEIAGRE